MLICFFFFRKRALTTKEIEDSVSQINKYGLADSDSEYEEPFPDSGSEYLSESDISSESDLELSAHRATGKRKRNSRQKFKKDLLSSDNTSSDEIGNAELEVERNIEQESEEPDTVPEVENNIELQSDEPEVEPNTSPNSNIHWNVSRSSFTPAKSVPTEPTPTILHAGITHKSSELECFLQLFPRSLFIFMSQCTNERLIILQEKTKKPYISTDYHEIMLVIGCYLVMAYNKVPSLTNYWSSNKSLGNEAIKSAISRDRFLLLTSKMYYNHPVRPENSDKLYYISEVVSCLKHTFQKTRSDSTFQSIDESMVKFKGRSVLKQYLPLKPIKRGIKIWERCDSETGYVYDLNIYSGKDDEKKEGTLGERVIIKLCSSIRDKNVMLCFDRFFTTVALVANLDFAAVGTCMSNRKNFPKFEKKKMNKGDCQTLFSDLGVIAHLWKDSKEVLVLSNCHTDHMGTVERRIKDGTKIRVPCPDAIIAYNKYMGGVDLSDQISSLYEIDRKSQKWWRKTFYKLLLTAVSNAWIIYKEAHNRNVPFIAFLVNLAEGLISTGRQNAAVVRKRCSGRPSNSSRNLVNVGDHLPYQANTRRRCHSCTSRKVEKRTKTMCSGCNIPLCNDCFQSYHR